MMHYHRKPTQIPMVFLIIFMLFSCTNKAQDGYFNDIAKQRAKGYSKARIKETPTVDTAQLMIDLRIISHDSLAGRLPGSAGSKIAQKYIIDRMQSLKIAAFEPSYLQEFRIKKDITAANIIGFIKGSKNPEKYIVLSAHYDHLGIINGKIYNGADDDGSGVCALLAMMDYFSKNKPATSLVFCFFDAEEKGLLGSNYFVSHAPMMLANIKLNINMDMIARNDKHDEIIAVGTAYNPELRTKLQPLLSMTNIALIFGFDQPGSKDGIEDWTQSSDHGSFHNKGIPFIYFGVVDHEDYHGPGDDFEKIDPVFYGAAVNLITKAIILLDQ